MRSRFGTSFLLLIIAAAISVKAEPQNKPAGPEVKAYEETGVLRLLNAAESAYLQAHGQYGSLADLIQSGQIQQTANQSSDYLRALQLLSLDSPVPLPGFSLGIVVSASGTGYHIYLTQRGERCGAGWFTDETGILYGGKALDCEEASAIANATGWSPPDIDAAVPPVEKDTPCPLQEILHQASERATELVDNLQRFTATERIEHTEFGKDGKARRTSEAKFNYVAEIDQGASGTFWVEEYRSAMTEVENPPLSDTGTAAFALIFHPRFIGNFDVRCEGKTEFEGRPAWQLRFEESPHPSSPFHQIRINRLAYQLRFKGRAWIAADDYQVLRLQTDLVAPIQQIDLQVEHLDIAYAPVEFAKKSLRLWLPESASMHIGYRGHRYRRVHTFSHFQLFMVDTQEKVKPPPSAPVDNSTQ